MHNKNLPVLTSDINQIPSAEYIKDKNSEKSNNHDIILSKHILCYWLQCRTLMTFCCYFEQGFEKKCLRHFDIR